MIQDLFGAPAHSGAGVTHNLFFGLMPNAATQERMSHAVERLRTRHATHGRWLKPHRYHLTLHYLGSFQPLREDLVASAMDAASRVNAARFDLVLDQAGAFPRNRVGWLGADRTDPGLQQLWDQLRQELTRAHVKIEGASQFKPHVTVLRDAKDVLPVGPIEPIHWPVREFVLVDSQLGSRNVYEPLGSWTLA